MRGLTFPFEFMTCPVSQNHPILLANLLQRSRTAFSRVSFSSFFAFKEGMYDTQIAALLSSPTVSQGFLRQSPSLTTRSDCIGRFGLLTGRRVRHITSPS